MKTILLIAALVASPSIAAPTYLACSLASAGHAFGVNVTADEANQTVTMEIPSTGFAQRRPALFSATTVSFDVPIGVSSIAYKIDRTSLAFERTIATPTAVIGTDKGECKVQTAPKRAF